MQEHSVFQAIWREDGSCTALARVTARDATGAATGISGEGKWVKQADLSTITCKVFDRNGTTPDTAIATPTVTIASAVYDTPVTDGLIWDVDLTGYNFLHDLAYTNFPEGNRKYVVEYIFTTTGGAKWSLVFEGVSRAIITS